MIVNNKVEKIRTYKQYKLTCTINHNYYRLMLNNISKPPVYLAI